MVVALSETVMKNCLKRPLADKSPWRHIWLAIKPRYLGNHASHIKSYYGTLSRSHGRSFRIHHENSPKAPPGGEITMTSYPACNKTLLSQKPCIPDKKLLWITIRKSWSLFQNPSWKIAWSAPWWSNHDDVISGLQNTPLSWKPRDTDKKLQWFTFMKSWSLIVIFINQQILIQKTYQFIKVVNGMSHSHKTANIFFSFDSLA